VAHEVLALHGLGWRLAAASSVVHIDMPTVTVSSHQICEADDREHARRRLARVALIHVADRREHRVSRERHRHAELGAWDSERESKARRGQAPKSNEGQHGSRLPAVEVRKIGGKVA